MINMPYNISDQQVVGLRSSQQPPRHKVQRERYPKTLEAEHLSISEVETQRLGPPRPKPEAPRPPEKIHKNHMKKVCSIVLNVLSLILKVAMFLTGMFSLKDCPAQQMIPIYLTVAGSLGILVKITFFANCIRNSIVIRGIMYTLLFFEFVWMIVGMYLIFSIDQPQFQPYYGVYCEETVYNSAKAFAILHVLYFGLLVATPILKKSLGLW